MTKNNKTNIIKFEITSKVQTIETTCLDYKGTQNNANRR